MPLLSVYESTLIHSICASPNGCIILINNLKTSTLAGDDDIYSKSLKCTKDRENLSAQETGRRWQSTQGSFVRLSCPCSKCTDLSKLSNYPFSTKDISSVLLSGLFRQSLAVGSVPTDWKVGKVGLIHTGGNKSYVNSYKPISLKTYTLN